MRFIRLIINRRIFLARFDSEEKWFDCKVPSNNSEYCDYWSVLEGSVDEFEIGNVNCTSPSANKKYCNSWFTEKKEYKKCWLYLVHDSDNGGYTYGTACCGDVGYGHEPCCQTICPVSFYNARVPQVEDIHCNCTTESENGEYCANWYCELDTVYDPYGQDQPVQHEWYTCTSSPDDKYCSTWTGKIDSKEEFEVASCSCQESSADGSYCANWICFEKGSDYWWPNLLWILFSIILGSLTFMIAFIGGWGVFVHPAFWFGHFIWAGGFLVIGIWKAGLVVMIISIQPLFVIPALVILVHNLRIYDWSRVWYVGLNNLGDAATPAAVNGLGWRRGGVPTALVIVQDVQDVELAAATLVEISMTDLKKGYVDVAQHEGQLYIDNID